MGMELRNLEGLPGRHPVESFARSRTEAARSLFAGNVVTAAGDDGALNLWRDTDGNYRAEFFRHFATKSRLATKRKSEVREWLATWWPQMGRE